MEIALPDIELRILDPRIETPRHIYQSAAYDLHLCSINGIPLDFGSRWSEYLLKPGETVQAGTGISFSLAPHNLCAFILPRFGLGGRGVVPANSPGLIDPDYQGEIIIYLHNFGSDSVVLFPLQRIARLLFFQPVHPKFQQVTHFSRCK